MDDDAANRDLLARRLAREGYEVRTAADGGAALAALEPGAGAVASGSWSGSCLSMAAYVKPRSFEWINLHIQDDATFELTGEWGIQSSGVLIVQQGQVRFEGDRAWRGTLALTEAAEGPTLKLERSDRTEQATLHRWPRRE